MLESSNLSKELIVIITAVLPVVERGAIPLAILSFNFSPLKAYFLSLFGNLLPVVPLFFFLKFASQKLREKSRFFEKLFKLIFEHVQKRHGKQFERWKGAALFFLVALPLPFTGVWSGTVAAFVFGTPFRNAILTITLGTIVYGAIVLFFSMTPTFFKNL